MKHLYFLISVLITSFGIAQTPNVIYYPNSVNTPTSLPMGSIEYLCGPNTIVYDTLVHGCKIYVSNNCTLTMNTKCSVCPGVTYVYLQGNSILNIFPGNCSNFYFVSEPTAIINNPMNVAIWSSTTTTISWPTVNCAANGIKSNNLDSKEISLFPNPASYELNISFNTQTKIEHNQILIYNTIGQLIREEEIIFKNNQAIIKTEYLQSGVYYLNLNGVNKRFVIAR